MYCMAIVESTRIPNVSFTSASLGLNVFIMFGMFGMFLLVVVSLVFDILTVLALAC